MKFEVKSYSWDLKRWIDKIACGEIHRKRLVSGYQASDLPHSVVAHIIKWLNCICDGCNGRVRAAGLGGERGQAGTKVVAESEG